MDEVFARSLEIIREMPDKPYFYEGVVAMLVLVLLLTLMRMARKRYSSIEVFRTGSSSIRVTKKAFIELIQATCVKLGATGHPVVYVWLRGDTVNVDISLKLEAGQKLTELNSRIQEQVTKTLNVSLGIEKIGPINILVTGFRGEADPDSMVPVSNVRPDPVDVDPFNENESWYSTVEPAKASKKNKK